VKWIVTGGCGFIGTNVVERLIRDGVEPAVLDNVSRPRVHQNLAFLRDSLGVDVTVADVRDSRSVDHFIARHADAVAVLHLAGQVSFMASLNDPRTDFETNALGTFNVAEAVLRHCPNATLLYSSTNKVYGTLAELRTVETETRYELPDFPNGIPTGLPLRPSGGYAISKMTADQLLLDWSVHHGLRTVVFRQSSVYGGRQFATEDQGWAAFFAERFVSNTPFTISGTGKQVRDLLHVGDLYQAFLAAADTTGPAKGRCFNIGGGPSNNLSLLEMFDALETRTGNRPPFDFLPPRPADQKVFIADVAELADLGWTPSVGVETGLDDLVAWAEQISAGAI
jgi:CDP-paratose 2-epimerase